MTKEKTAEELLLEEFGGSRMIGCFKNFTDEEYIGYVVGVTKIQNLSSPANIMEFIHTARKLFKEGKL